MIEGINIFTKSPDWLGKALTNPSYAKNNKSEYDIEANLKIHPKDYILPNINLFEWAKKRYGLKATAENAWGKSVEAWYFANTKLTQMKQFEKEQIMKQLIICKFSTYPKLIIEIDKRGGLEFLKKCSHIISGNKHWEGVGEKSNFIKVLISAYKNVKGIVEIEQKELL